VHESAWRDRQAEPFAKQRRDFGEGQAELFVQHDGHRDRGRPELRGGGADRIRCLQRMASLHAPPAVRTPADRDIERAHEGSNVGQIFLVLRGVPRGSQAPAALRTAGWQRCRMAFVDLRRDSAMGAPAVRGTRLAAGPPRPTTWRAPRERCRLPMQRPPRIIQFVLEPLDCLAQTVPFLTIPIALAPQLLPFALLPFELRDQLLA
jgi:hypothetical protein